MLISLCLLLLTLVPALFLSVSARQAYAGPSKNSWPERHPLPRECASPHENARLNRACIANETARVGTGCSTLNSPRWSEEDWVKSAECPTQPKPEGLLFHSFWDGPLRPKQLKLVDSFLITQELMPCTKFVYWFSDPAALDDPAIKNYRLDFAKYVEFRRFDLRAEAAGTCLETKRELWDSGYQRKLGLTVTPLSDLYRVLILWRYGGVWLDADTLLLRDLMSLVQMLGPFAPRNNWNTNTLQHNNHVLYFGSQPGSTVASRLMPAICYKLPFDPSLWRFSWDEGEANRYMVWNVGLLSRCEKKGCGLSPAPMAWVDPDMMCGGCSAVCRKDFGMALAGPPATIKNAFVWHARWLRNELCQGEAVWKTAMGPVWRVMERHFERGVPLRGQDMFPPEQHFVAVEW
ncbi:unnamed protein product [Phaeothamnion confervicola]